MLDRLDVAHVQGLEASSLRWRRIKRSGKMLAALPRLLRIKVGYPFRMYIDG